MRPQSAVCVCVCVCVGGGGGQEMLAAQHEKLRPHNQPSFSHTVNSHVHVHVPVCMGEGGGGGFIESPPSIQTLPSQAPLDPQQHTP
jgi:hypothetical protein